MLHIMVGIYVLKIFERRISGCLHQFQKACKIRSSQSLRLLFYSLVFIEEMHCTQHAAVAQFFSERRNIADKFFFVHIAQHLFSKYPGHTFHFQRNHGVIFRQIRVRSLRIHDTQAVIFRSHIHLFHHRMGRILKIDINQTAYGTRHLIHQPAGFAKIYIFRILSNHSSLHRRNFHLIKQTGKDGSQDRLKSGGRGQPRSV